MKRFWTYQKERFPVFAHGLLIAAFSSCAVSYSALLTGGNTPAWQAYLVAFVTCFLFFLQLRIADEFKDAEEDAQFRPYRPVPRGLVTLRELGAVFALAAAIQLALALWYFPALAIVLVIAWGYLTLMSVEFFARDWLKARPITYLWTHMFIMPIVDFYATACDWLPRGEKPVLGLAFFLAASFCNGLLIEVGRKLRQPADEEKGVPTYSKLWGVRGGSWTWWIILVVTAGLGLASAALIGFFAVPAIVFSLCVVLAFPLTHRFRSNGLNGKAIENFTGLWTLALYLCLGLIPLLAR